MKINKYPDENLLENYIDIHYKEMNPIVQGIIEYCEAFQVIIGKQNNVQKKIVPSEIYCCEI